MESFEDMKTDAESQLRELQEKYPTPESMVDDYRNALISEGALNLRFPSEDDRNEVLRIAKERNEAEPTDQ